MWKYFCILLVVLVPRAHCGPGAVNSANLTSNSSSTVVNLSSIRTRVGGLGLPNITPSNIITTSPVNTDGCNNKEDWYKVGDFSYCVSRNNYKYTEAISFCNYVNGTLVDLDVASKDVITRLFLSNVFQPGSEVWVYKRLLSGQFAYIENQGALHSILTPDSSEKHKALCNKFISVSKPSLYSSTVKTSITTKASAMTSDSISPASLIKVSPLSNNVLQPSYVITYPLSSSVLPSTWISNSASILSPSPLLSVSTSVSYLKSSTATSSARSNSVFTHSNQKQPWITIGESEYFLDKHRRTYISALDNCHNMKNASLITFLAPIGYFQVFSELRVSNFSYWIKAGANASTIDSKCVAFHGVNRTMSMLPCEDRQFSVCKRSIYGNDTDQPLLHPQFIQLLKEMTIDKAETVVNKRRLQSAEDHRTSAKTAGGLGIFLLCSIISIMLILDLTRMRC